MNSELEQINRIERPFPLLRYFVIYVLPLLALGVIGLSFTVRETISTSIEAFHAVREKSNAEYIVNTIYAASPQQWATLADGPSRELDAEIVSELKELGIACLSFLDSKGKVLFSGSIGENCNVPGLDVYAEVIETGIPELRENIARDGYWTSLVSLTDPGSRVQFLAALSRPSRDLETTIGFLSISRTLFFGGSFLAACVFAFWLAFRAQRALDASFEALNLARVRMQRFLSKGARQNAILGKVSATKYDAVVMFADLRNFSGFAETANVEETADLIDKFVTIVTNVLEQEDGDVENFLGDGVLAWFKGDGANERSIQAAIKCIQGCKDLPRRPGIGLFRGEIIAAPLGHGERMDFTILGRPVNLASRLCSAAAVDEISAPADMTGFLEAGLIVVGKDTVIFKNHVEPVQVSKYKLSPGS